MRRIVIKLGSSIVADDGGEVRADVLGRVCDAVAGLRQVGDEVIVVTSGAIARGMREMGLPARPTAIADLQAASAVGQGKLFRVYDELLRARDVMSAQVLLTFFDMSARLHYLNARQTLRKLLDWGVVPVINENDTTTTDEISFGDNDFLAAQVAILIAADLLVLLTDTDGLYTADPRLYAGAARGRDVAAAGRRRRRAGALRRGRRGRDRRGRRRSADRQGDRQLLRDRVAAGHGLEERAGARGAAAGERGGGP